MLGPIVVALLLSPVHAAPEFGLPDETRFVFQKSSATAPAAFAFDISPTARGFLEKNGADFTRFHASFESMEAVPADFREMTDIWRVKGELDAVFKRFTGSAPTDWNGAAAFELLWDPASAALYDKTAGVFPAAAEGQIILLTLNLPGVKLSTAFQFVSIDEEKREVSFSYLSINAAIGVQRASFTQDGDEVVVTHVARYKSGSLIRDALLYPLVHRALLDDFYDRVLAQD